MQKAIAVNPKYIRSLRHLMATKDIRYYLNGVLVQCSDKGKFYVATNGDVLGVYREPWTDGEEAQSCELIIPGDVVKAIKPARHDLPALLIEREGGQWEIRADNGQTFTPIDGKFPDWTRIVPKDKPNGAGGHFNYDYMADFNACARDGWGAKYSVELYSRGPKDSAVVLNGCKDFFGVIMPMTPASDGELPEWAKAL